MVSEGHPTGTGLRKHLWSSFIDGETETQRGKVDAGSHKTAGYEQVEGANIYCGPGILLASPIYDFSFDLPEHPVWYILSSYYKQEHQSPKGQGTCAR